MSWSSSKELFLKLRMMRWLRIGRPLAHLPVGAYCLGYRIKRHGCPKNKFQHHLTWHNLKLTGYELRLNSTQSEISKLWVEVYRFVSYSGWTPLINRSCSYPTHETCLTHLTHLTKCHFPNIPFKILDI